MSNADVIPYNQLIIALGTCILMPNTNNRLLDVGIF